MLSPNSKKYKDVQALLTNDNLTTLPSYQAFANDVHRLLELDADDFLPGITASVWLEKLLDLDADSLTTYVKNYKAGQLNPLRRKA